MIPKLKEAYDFRALLGYLILIQLQQRYQGSVLGFLWTLVGPLLVFASFSVIFGLLNGSNLKDYGIYFFSGYICWNLFANTCQSAAESVVGNWHLVTRIRIPRILLPFTSVAVNLVDLGAGLVVIVFLMVLFGAPVRLAIAFLPVSILITVAFSAGVGLLCAVANVFLRDFRHLLSSLLFLWFFFSPILWNPVRSNPSLAVMAKWNPVYPFLQLFQAPLWQGALPQPVHVWASGLIAVAALVVGVFVFLRYEDRFYYYL